LILLFNLFIALVSRIELDIRQFRATTIGNQASHQIGKEIVDIAVARMLNL